MCDELKNAIAVLSLDSEINRYDLDTSHPVSEVRELIESLTVEEDRELGIEPVYVVVIADDAGLLYDILLNEKTVGYTYLKAIAATFGLTIPSLLAQGRDEDIDVGALCEEYDYNLYTLPLFGEAA